MPQDSTINWLHLSDWHVGEAEQGHLWPTFRSDVESDLAQHMGTHGPIDLVLFTGDLVNSGKAEEFDQLERNLGRLWRFFNAHGSRPRLVVIPGNHDLERPDPNETDTLALSSWNQNHLVRAEFWSNPNSGLRRCVDRMFENFLVWRRSTRIPLIDSVPGLLPGDFAASFEKNGFRVGIVGLNSTFLQFRSGDLQGSLDLSARQLAPVPDYIDWLGSHQASILMTHHPENWLRSEAQDEFRSEIAKPGRYQLQLSGHLHSPRFVQIREGGSEFRMLAGGTSFFGLERSSTDPVPKREHGYTIGQWLRKDRTIQERIWPRRLVQRAAGHRVLVPDPSVDHRPDGSIDRDFKIAGNPPEVVSGPEIVYGSNRDVEISVSAVARPAPRYRWQVWVSDAIEVNASITSSPVRVLSPFTDKGFVPDEEKGQFIFQEAMEQTAGEEPTFYRVSLGDVAASATVYDPKEGKMVVAREGWLVPLLSGGVPVIDSYGKITFMQSTWLHECTRTNKGYWMDLRDNENIMGALTSRLTIRDIAQCPGGSVFRCIAENRAGWTTSKAIGVDRTDAL